MGKHTLVVCKKPYCPEYFISYFNSMELKVN